MIKKLGVILLIFGLAISVSSFIVSKDIHKKDYFAERGVHTLGEVIQVVKKNRQAPSEGFRTEQEMYEFRYRQDTIYKILVRYSVSDKTFMDWKSLGTRSPKIINGNKISMVYDSRHPEKFILSKKKPRKLFEETSSSLNFIYISLFGTGGGLFAIGLVFLFVNKRKPPFVRTGSN